MIFRSVTLILACAFVTSSCDRGVDVDDVPLGSSVALTRDDGGVVEGKLAAKDEKLVAVDTGSVTRSVPRDQIADVQPVEADKPVELPSIAKFREYSIAAGTELSLEVDSPVNTATSRVGEPVRARLARAVSAGGVLLLPAGAPVVGEITAIQPSGKVKGRASVTISFNRVEAGGESYPINARFGATAPSTRADDAKKIGIPAAGGAVVGGIIGGKKGAAIGAAIGGGAGTTAVLMTAGDEITIGRGARLSVVLASPVDVRLPVTPKNQGPTRSH